MTIDTVVPLAAPARDSDPLTELLRPGAAAADCGHGLGGVRSREAVRRAAAGGSQRLPSRAQGSHRSGGGGRPGSPEPFRSSSVAAATPYGRYVSPRWRVIRIPRSSPIAINLVVSQAPGFLITSSPLPAPR